MHALTRDQVHQFHVKKFIQQAKFLWLGMSFGVDGGSAPQHSQVNIVFTLVYTAR